MELFTLNPIDLNLDKMIESYESLIWTERFIEPGDTRIVVPASRAMYKQLAPGTLVRLSASREPMLLETRSIEDGMMTVTGKTVEAFFEHRTVRKTKYTDVPGKILGAVVNQMQTEHVNLTTRFARIRTGLLDETGDVVTERIAAGPAYTALQGIANKHHVGMALYWTKRDTNDGYDLVFSTRTGTDLTRAQNEHNFVLFSPELDNFADIKELTSVAGSKTVVIIRAPKNYQELFPTSPQEIGIGDVLVQVDTGPYHDYEWNPFTARMGPDINTDDITTEDLGDGTPLERRTVLYDIMASRGKSYLKQNLKTVLIDGELPQAALSQYRYYLEANTDDAVEYRLGDIVEIGGNYTDPIPGVVAEYIYSVDGSGVRSYPTITPKPLPLYVTTGGGLYDF